jgi:hypothetical protein
MSQNNLLNALQALQGQTITPELLQSLMSSVRTPPPPPPPCEEEAGESVDDLLIAQQVAELDQRILASMAAPQIQNFRSRIVDPFANEHFSDSDDDELVPATPEISEQRSSLDALLNKHNLTTIADDENSDHSASEDLIDPEIFASIPDRLPSGESEIFAGVISSLLEDGKLAVVTGSAPLDVGTSLAFKNSLDRSIIAVVVDTFGSVTAPLLLVVARPGNLFTPDQIGLSLFTVSSLAQQILLDEANGVFAIRGQQSDFGIHELEFSGDLSDEDDAPPPPAAAGGGGGVLAAPRAPSGFSWK